MGFISLSKPIGRVDEDTNEENGDGVAESRLTEQEAESGIKMRLTNAIISQIEDSIRRQQLLSLVCNLSPPLYQYKHGDVEGDADSDDDHNKRKRRMVMMKMLKNSFMTNIPEEVLNLNCLHVALLP